MDKNTIIGLLLIAGILFTFTLVTEPETEEVDPKTEIVVNDRLNDTDPELPKTTNPSGDLDSVPESIKKDTVKFNEYKESIADAEKLHNQNNYGINNNVISV